MLRRSCPLVFVLFVLLAFACQAPEPSTQEESKPLATLPQVQSFCEQLHDLGGQLPMGVNNILLALPSTNEHAANNIYQNVTNACDVLYLANGFGLLGEPFDKCRAPEMVRRLTALLTALPLAGGTGHAPETLGGYPGFGWAESTVRDTVSEVIMTTFRTFNAMNGECGGSLWCAKYGGGDGCAGDVGPEGISACRITAAHGGDCRLVGPGRGDLFHGLDCNMYPECVIPSGSREGPIDPADLPYSTGVLVNRLLNAATNYCHSQSGTASLPRMPLRAPSPIQACFDYSTFIGCKYRHDYEAILEPLFLVETTTTPMGGPLVERFSFDTGFSSTGQKVAFHEAVRDTYRVMAGIPNSSYRMNYIIGHSWSPAAIAAYLHGVNADAVLRGWIGDVGLAILRQAYANYALFAVPAPGEPTFVPRPGNWMGGCELATTSSMTVALTVTATTVTAELFVLDDPLGDEPLANAQPVLLDWGDGAVTSLSIPWGNGGYAISSHTYAASSTVTITARYINSAGLETDRSLTVTLTAPGTPQVTPTVQTVQLNGSLLSSRPGSVQVEAFFLVSDYSGHDFAGVKTFAAPTTTVAIQLDNTTQLPAGHLAIRLNPINLPGDARFALKSVVMTFGPVARQVTIPAANLRLRSTTHAMTANGAILVPIDGAVVDIPIISQPQSVVDLGIAEPAVSDSLILNLDAATATVTGFPGAGCAVTTWADRSPAHLNGTLSGFSGCQTNGWQGDGSATNPYALVFDGVSNYVQLPTMPSSLALDSGLTIEVWAKPTSNGSWARFIDFGNGTADSNILFTRQGTSGVLFFQVLDGSTSWGTPGAISRDGTIAASKWQQLVATQVSNGGGPCGRCSATGYLYANGALVNNPSLNTITSLRIDRRLNYIGRSNWAADAYFRGSIAVVRLYTRPLSQAEVYRNCLALQPRFDGVTCYDPQGAR